MNGLAAVAAPANVSGRHLVRDVFEKVHGGSVQVRDDWRRMSVFRFFLGIWPRHQVRWNDEAQRFGPDAGAIGDDEIAKSEQRFVFFPHGDVQKRVRANHEINTVAVAVVDVAEIAHGIHGIVQLRAAEVFTGFDK